MSEEKIIKALIKKWWLILIVTLFCVGVTLHIVNNSKPIYQATTTLYAMATSKDQKAGISYDDIAVNQQIIKDYSELIKSERITSLVVNELGIDGINSEELSENVSIDIVKGSNVFKLSYQDTKAETAQIVANEFAKVLIDKMGEVTNKTSLSIVDEAKIPSNPIEASKSKSVILSFLLSLISICGIIVLTTCIDNTARTVEDVEKELGYSVIGIIPKMDIK